MPTAERMLGEYAAQLTRVRVAKWRWMNVETGATAEAERLRLIVGALAATVLGVEAVRPVGETGA